MNIQSKQQLWEIINHDRHRSNLPLILTWIDKLKMECLLFLHPGNVPLYMYCLRKEEYGLGRGNFLVKYYYGYWRRRLQNLTQVELPPGVAAPGVTVNHGKCVVSASATIGRDCVILSDVTIGGVGGKRDKTGAAHIGDRVFIGSGARIIGPVTIADNVVIGANSVVVKDILEEGITVAGNPAHKISNKGSDYYINY